MISVVFTLFLILSQISNDLAQAGRLQAESRVKANALDLDWSHLPQRTTAPTGFFLLASTTVSPLQREDRNQTYFPEPLNRTERDEQQFRMNFSESSKDRNVSQRPTTLHLLSQSTTNRQIDLRIAIHRNDAKVRHRRQEEPIPDKLHLKTDTNVNPNSAGAIVDAAVPKTLNRLLSKVSAFEKIMDSKFEESNRSEFNPAIASLYNQTSASNRDAVAKMAVSIIRDEATKLQKIIRRLVIEVINKRILNQVHSVLEKLLKQTQNLFFIVDSTLPNTADSDLISKREKDEYQQAFMILEEIRESKQLSKEDVAKKAAKVISRISKIIHNLKNRLSKAATIKPINTITSTIATAEHISELTIPFTTATFITSMHNTAELTDMNTTSASQDLNNNFTMPGTTALTDANKTTTLSELNNLTMTSATELTVQNQTMTSSELNNLTMTSTVELTDQKETLDSLELSDFRLIRKAELIDQNEITNSSELNDLKMPGRPELTDQNETTGTTLSELNNSTMTSTAELTDQHDTTSSPEVNNFTMTNTNALTEANETIRRPDFDGSTTNVALSNQSEATPYTLNNLTTPPALSNFSMLETTTIISENNSSTTPALNDFRAVPSIHISQPFINEAVIKMLNKLVSNVHALQETLALACKHCEQTAKPTKTYENDTLLLDNISISEDTTVVTMKAISVIRIEATKLRSIFRQLSREVIRRRMRIRLYNALRKLIRKATAFYESISDGLSVNNKNDSVRMQLKNREMQVFEILQSEDKFQQLGRREASETAVKVIAIVSTIIQGVVRQFKNAIIGNRTAITISSNTTDVYETLINVALIKEINHLVSKVSVLREVLVSALPAATHESISSAKSFLNSSSSAAKMQVVAATAADIIRIQAKNLRDIFRLLSTEMLKRGKNDHLNEVLTQSNQTDFHQLSEPATPSKAAEQGALISNNDESIPNTLRKRTLTLDELIKTNGRSNDNLPESNERPTQKHGLSKHLPKVLRVQHQTKTDARLKAGGSVANNSNLAANIMTSGEKSRKLATERMNDKSVSNRSQNFSPSHKGKHLNGLPKKLAVHHHHVKPKVRPKSDDSNIAENRKKRRKSHRALTLEQMNDVHVGGGSQSFSPIQKVNEDDCGCRQRDVVTSAEYIVYHIQTGNNRKMVDTRDVHDSQSEFQIEGLDKVDKYRNKNVSLEFAFKRPLLMSAIGFTSTPHNAIGFHNDDAKVKQTTIYLEKSTNRHLWLPLLTNDTNNVMLFNMSSNALHSLAQSNDTLSGIRLYPQDWSTNPATIARPIFVYCASKL